MKRLLKWLLKDVRGPIAGNCDACYGRRENKGSLATNAMALV